MLYQDTGNPDVWIHHTLAESQGSGVNFNLVKNVTLLRKLSSSETLEYSI